MQVIQLARLTLAIGGGTVLLVIYIFITEDSRHTWGSVGFIVLALVALGVLGVVGMLEESYGRPVWIALVSVTVVTKAIATAAATADDAEDGCPVSMTILGIPSPPSARLRFTSPDSPTSRPACCSSVRSTTSRSFSTAPPLAPPGGCHHDHDGLPGRLTRGQDRLSRAPPSIR